MTHQSKPNPAQPQPLPAWTAVDNAACLALSALQGHQPMLFAAGADDDLIGAIALLNAARAKLAALRIDYAQDAP